MAGIIDMTSGSDRILQGLFSGDGRRGPRRPKEKEEGGGKIEELLSIAEASKRCGLSRHRLDACDRKGRSSVLSV